MGNGMRRELLRMWLRRRDGVALHLSNLGRPLRREVRRHRRLPLLTHIGLHVRMGLRRRIGVLWPGLRHIGGNVGILLGVVDGRVRHVGKAVDGRALWRSRGSYRLHHVWWHPPHVVPRARPRTHLRLWGMGSLHDLSGVLGERHAVGNGRRR